MRARGLRPIQVWVPDTRTAAFGTEAHRQSRAVAEGALEREDQDFIDAISDSGKADSGKVMNRGEVWTVSGAGYSGKPRPAVIV